MFNYLLFLYFLFNTKTSCASITEANFSDNLGGRFLLHRPNEREIDEV